MVHSNWVNKAQFSPDGQWVVFGTGGGLARVWDVNSSAPVSEFMEHGGDLSALSFSPDGQRILTSSKSAQSARLWDARTGNPMGQSMRHRSAVVSAEFSPDGLRILTASEGGFARLWDGHTGESLGSSCSHPQNWQPDAGLIGARFSPNGARVHTFSPSQVCVWDGVGSPPVRHRLRTIGVAVATQFDRAGSKLLLAVDRQRAGIFDVHSGRHVTDITGIVGNLNHSHFSPDGRLVATRSGDLRGTTTVQFWDATSGAARSEAISFRGGGDMKFSRDGKILAVQALASLHFVDVTTGRTNGMVLDAGRRIVAYEFSPDGRQLVTCSVQGAKIWDLSNKEAPAARVLHDGAMIDAQFSEDGRWVATASADGTVQFWNSATGRPRGTPMRHPAPVNRVRFSPDGRWVATACRDGKARLWDVSSGEAVGEPLRHQSNVTAVEFSNDGNRVLTASDDATARVWDPSTGQALCEPLRHEGNILRAQFDRQGLTVMTITGVGKVSVWDIPSVPNGGATPAWLHGLAEAVAGVRLTDGGDMEPVPIEAYLQLRDRLQSANPVTPIERWLAWFFGDRRNRTVSPFSAMTLREYVLRCVEEGTVESLKEAVRLDPTAGLAYARLANAMVDALTEPNVRLIGEADFYSRHAAKITPDDPQVKSLRGRFLATIAERFPGARINVLRSRDDQ